MSIENYSGEAFLVQGARVSRIRCHFYTERKRIPLDDTGAKWIDGLARWRGTLVEHDGPIELGVATLELPGGERGEIVITGSVLDMTTVGSQWMTAAAGPVEFYGTGTPPE